MLLPVSWTAAETGSDASREAYRLSASRSADGVITLFGTAPDMTSQQRLLRAAGLTPPAEGGDETAWRGGIHGLAVDSAAPAEPTPGLAHRALRAFSLLEAGRLSIADTSVSLEGRARDATALERLEGLLDPEWFAAVWVDAEPPGLVLSIDERGRLTAEGVLPPGLERAVLADALPGLSLPERGGGLLLEGDQGGEEAALAPERAPRPTAAPAVGRAAPPSAAVPFVVAAAPLSTPAESAVWRSVLAALPIALPRMERGTIALGPRRIEIEGRLRPGFSAADIRAALRAALRGATNSADTLAPGTGDAEISLPTALTAPPDAAWQIRLDLIDAPPPARLTIAFADGTLSLAGILPEGLDAETALIRGGGARRAGLTSGGRGDPFLWREIVDAMAALREVLIAAEGQATSERIALAGTLRPGQDAATVEAFLAAQLAGVGEAPVLELALTETPAAEGDERTDLATGGRERLTSAGWAPVPPAAPRGEDKTPAADDLQSTD